MVWVFIPSSVYKRWLATAAQKRYGTYVEDMEDPVEVQLPSSDFVLIVLGVEESRGHVPPTLFDGLPLYFCNGPTIERTLRGWFPSADSLFNSRR